MKLLGKLCTVSGVVGLALCFCGSMKAQEKLTVDSIFTSKELSQKGLSGIANLLEEKEYYKLEEGVLSRYVRQKKGREKKYVLLDPSKDSRFADKKYKPQSYVFNKDKSRVLLLSDYKAIYRRSGTCEAVVWTSDAKGNYTQAQLLSQDGPIQIPTFSPDGNKVAFVRENNIYYIDLTGGQTVQVTTDGRDNEIRNGHTDWVYEEEFGFVRAYDWRPDSKAIAYLKFDESGLKQYDMTMWGGLYPETYRYKYPKAGEDNSKVSVWLYEMENPQAKAEAVAWESEEDLKPAGGAGNGVAAGSTIALKINADSIEYLPRIFYQEALNKLMVYSMNRHQSHLRIWAFDASDMKAAPEVMYEERNKAYIEVPDNLYFFKDGSKMLLTTERDGYNHLYLFKTDGKDRQGICLTPGAYDVTGLYGVDEARGRVYFQAAYSAPQNREVLRVGLDGKNLFYMARDMQLKGGTTNAWFNGDFTYMILQHSKANQASAYYLYHVSGESEQLMECLQANNHFEQLAKKYAFVEKEFLRIPVAFTDMSTNAFMQTTDFGKHRVDETAMATAQTGSAAEGQVELQAWMMKPAEIGTPEAEGRKYPVLMFLYGGPGSQQVTNSLQPYQTRDYLWYQMLVNEGYIVVCVDNRGTMARGEAFKKCTYLQLGKYETEDQVAAAKWLGTLPYVDSTRIGIWGWSYGGFMSSNCLLRGEGTFKMAMAVAPVTNWKYYDNIYTERFMRTPQENPDGYELGSPIHYADKLNGAYLLVHGSGDDNVHIQNSMDLMSALQKANKPFDMMIYPNKNHSMVNNEGSAQKHLYNKLTKFIHENL